MLIKSPPTSGKSRALMFIALDKLENQELKQAIIVVPEKATGSSFNNESLSELWLLDRLLSQASFEEQRCQQIKDWQALSGAARRAAAWELVTDYWINMKGKHPDELRLQRSITKLTRV